MKKILSIFLILSLSLSVTGCTSIFDKDFTNNEVSNNNEIKEEVKEDTIESFKGTYKNYSYDELTINDLDDIEFFLYRLTVIKGNRSEIKDGKLIIYGTVLSGDCDCILEVSRIDERNVEVKVTKSDWDLLEVDSTYDLEIDDGTVVFP